MNPHLKSGLTLGVLAIMVIAGAVWGWTALTEPFPKPAPPPKCQDVDVAAGDKVRRDEVTVSVFNAGKRVGLAKRTLELLANKGFAEGNQGNAPAGTKVQVAQVWAADASNPAVQLVVSWLPKGTKVVPGERLGDGVVVVVGDGFEALRKGRQKVKAGADTTICSPIELQ